MGSLDAFGKQLQAMIDQFSSTSEGRAAIKSLGVSTDSMVGHAHLRFDRGETPAGFIANLEKFYFKATGLPWMTDMSKSAFSQALATHIGEHASTGYSKLPDGFRSMIDRYDISSVEWDFIRTDVGDVSNNTFVDAKSVDWVKDHKVVLPDQITDATPALLKHYGLKDTPANRKKAVRDIKTKLLTLYSESANTGVPTPGVREERQLRFGTKPGTAGALIVDFLAMLKAFPLTAMNKAVAESFTGKGGSLTRAGMASWVKDGSGPLAIMKLVAFTTIAGYTSGVIKDALRGKTPKPLFNDDGSIRKKTLIDAMQRGGALGVFGDVMLSEYDRSYRSFSQAALGPVLGNLDPIAEIATKAAKGEEISRPAMRLGVDNLPFGNLFYIRPALEVMFWNELEEMVNPGNARKKAKALKEATGQEYWYQ